METADAERMNHAVCAAGQHNIDFAGANHFGRLANRLAAGSASRDAIGVGSLSIEMRRQMRGRHVQLQFQFIIGPPQSQRLLGELFRDETDRPPSNAAIMFGN